MSIFSLCESTSYAVPSLPSAPLPTGLYVQGRRGAYFRVRGLGTSGQLLLGVVVEVSGRAF